jgi:hypothetical protein
VRIVVLCEGATEAALRTALGEFLAGRTPPGERRIGVKLIQLRGSVFREKLGTLVARYSADSEVAIVIALTDVYPSFANAEAAKKKLAEQAGGSRGGRFRAHAAQFDFEAWLVPFWGEITKYLQVDAKPPGGWPEEINGQRPPSMHLRELYGRAGRKYEKAVEGPRWLTADRLEQSARACPELKAFLNSLLEFAGAAVLP